MVTKLLKHTVKKVKKPKYNRPKRIGNSSPSENAAAAAEASGLSASDFTDGNTSAMGTGSAGAGGMGGYDDGGGHQGRNADGSLDTHHAGGGFAVGSANWWSASQAEGDPSGYAAGDYGGAGGKDVGQIGSPSFNAAYHLGYANAAANAPSVFGIQAMHEYADAAGRAAAGMQNVASTYAGGKFGDATINQMLAGGYAGKNSDPAKAAALATYGGLAIDAQGRQQPSAPSAIQNANRIALQTMYDAKTDSKGNSLSPGVAAAQLKAAIDMAKSDDLRNEGYKIFLTGTPFNGSNDIGRYAQLGVRDDKTGIITYMDNPSFGRSGESGALARAANLMGVLSTIPGAKIPEAGNTLISYKSALVNAKEQITDRANATQRVAELAGTRNYPDLPVNVSSMSTKDIYTMIGKSMIDNSAKEIGASKLLSDPSVGTKEWTDKVAQYVGEKTGVNPISQAKIDFNDKGYPQTQGIINVNLPGGVKVLSNGQIVNQVTGSKLDTGARTYILENGGKMTVGAGKTAFDQMYTNMAWTGKGDPNEGKFAYTIDKQTGQPIPTAENVQIAEAFKSSIGSGGTVFGNNIGTVSPVTGMVWSGSSWMSPDTYQKEAPNSLPTTKQSIAIALGILPENAGDIKPLYSNIYNYYYDPYINPKDDPKKYVNPQYNPLTLGHNEPFTPIKTPGISGLKAPKTNSKKKNYDWMTLREQLGIPVSIGVYGKKKPLKRKLTQKKPTTPKNADDALMNEILYGKKQPAQKKSAKKPVKKLDYLNCGI